MAKKVQKADLAKGIEALFNKPTKTKVEKKELVQKLSNAVAMIDIDKVSVNRYQPRKEFKEEALEELSKSIKVHGLIQPITVRSMGDNTFELISGERRLRASKLAGLQKLPAYIRTANDQELMEMALIENIQREELNPMEIAFTYQRLIDEFELTHEQMADRVGKRRSTITNFLSLQKMPANIQTALKESKISIGHAKALKGLDSNVGLQMILLKKILDEGLSVRATEELVKSYKTPNPKQTEKKAPQLADAYVDIQNNLKKHLGAKVQLKRNNSGKGQIVINFTNDDDLNRLLDILDV